MTALTVDPDGGLTTAAVERPAPGPTEVLIKVHAAGVNPVDIKTRNGVGVNGFFDPSQPMILGWDVAGEVVEVGAGVTRFTEGDRVFGMPRFPKPANAYSEYVVAGSREVALTPKNLSDVEAAALPLASLTAWQSVIDTFKISQGDRILIHAASGGVGHLAVQIAKAQGAEVWGTASVSKHAQLKELGLDHAIDYHSERFEDVVSDMDFVLDLVQLNDYPTRSLKTIKPGGRLLVVPSPPDGIPSPDALKSANVSASWILVETDYASLEHIANMVEAGTLRVIVGDTRPLEQMDELHSISQTRPPLGKLVATLP